MSEPIPGIRKKGHLRTLKTNAICNDLKRLPGSRGVNSLFQSMKKGKPLLVANFQSHLDILQSPGNFVRKEPKNVIIENLYYIALLLKVCYAFMKK